MATLRSPPVDGRRWALLSVLAGTMLVDSLEIVLMGVALPSLRDDLGLPVWQAGLILAGFPLGFGLTLAPGRFLTWRFGRRPVYLGALAAFGLAASVSGLATDAVLLTGAELVKGCCAAVTAPVGIAVITTTFGQGSAQKRAMLVYSLFGTTGATAGMLISGVLSAASWRWALLVPLPVVVVLIALGLRHLPPDPAAAPRPPRLTRALLGTGGVRRAALGAACLNGTSVGLFVLLNLQLQNGSGWPAWRAALVCTPAYLTLAFSVLLAGRLIPRWGTAKPVAAGAVFTAAGCALYLADPSPGPDGGGVLTTTVLLGLGYLCSFAALNAGASAGLAPADRPAAGTVLQSAVQLGAVLTVIPATVLLSVEHDLRTALVPMGIAAAAGLAAALTGLRRGAPGT
ncbi:MFS transporter [Amycolatopsis sp. NPDC051071]|uniref:MFS transporter n=1 Tax=Amycolatopsis sp. NPDC051071 TaxID=3154637 RepID=UPI00344151C3